jgi:hypothetical protein
MHGLNRFVYNILVKDNELPARYDRVGLLISGFDFDLLMMT